MSVVGMLGCTPTPIEQEVQRSVARVFCSTGADDGVGTAFAIDRVGHAITAAHVVAPGGTSCTTLAVEFRPDERLPAKVIAHDPHRDLALIRVDGARPEPLVLAPGHRSVKGQPLSAPGFPVDADATDKENRRYVEPTFAPGTINRMHHDQDGVLVLQTNAALNPGHSGGPLVDECGRVLGVASRVRRGTGVENLAWAVDVRELEAFLGPRIPGSARGRGVCGETVFSAAHPWMPLAPAGVLALLLGVAIISVRGRRREGDIGRPPGPPMPPGPAPAPAPVVVPPDPTGEPARADVIGPTAPVRWFIRFTTGPLTGQTFSLVDRICIGRDRAFSTIPVPIGTTGVSRRHVEIALRDGVVQVKDVGSSGGTQVAGRQIPGGDWVSVDRGAAVLLGSDVEFVVEEH